MVQALSVEEESYRRGAGEEEAGLVIQKMIIQSDFTGYIPHLHTPVLAVRPSFSTEGANDT